MKHILLAERYFSLSMQQLAALDDKIRIMVMSGKPVDHSCMRIMGMNELLLTQWANLQCNPTIRLQRNQLVYVVTILYEEDGLLKVNKIHGIDRARMKNVIMWRADLDNILTPFGYTPAEMMTLPESANPRVKYLYLLGHQKDPDAAVNNYMTNALDLSDRTEILSVYSRGLI